MRRRSGEAHRSRRSATATRRQRRHPARTNLVTSLVLHHFSPITVLRLATQSQRHDEWTRTSKYAWRARLSMHISNGWSRQPEVRPVALRIPRRSGVRKTGAPSRFSYIGCVPPSQSTGYTHKQRGSLHAGSPPSPCETRCLRLRFTSSRRINENPSARGESGKHSTVQ